MPKAKGIINRGRRWRGRLRGGRFKGESSHKINFFRFIDNWLRRRGSWFGGRRSWIIHSFNIENVDFFLFFLLSTFRLRLRFIGRPRKNSTAIKRRRLTFDTRRSRCKFLVKSIIFNNKGRSLSIGVIFFASENGPDVVLLIGDKFFVNNVKSFRHFEGAEIQVHLAVSNGNCLEGYDSWSEGIDGDTKFILSLIIPRQLQ